MNYQIIQRDLLSGILVVDTAGKGSKYGNNENNNVFKSEYFYFYFETFLSPDIPGVMSSRRKTLLLMICIALITTN